jgi:purine-binding chemotaxis protein CheW
MSTPAVDTPATAAAPVGGKFLTFFLAEEEYGIEITKVQEIIGMLPITRVPRTPEYVRGVVNLRGKVIPIVDLRRKFGLDATGAEETCIIVVQVRGVQLGVVVDRVSEVSAVSPADIEEPPSFGADVHTEYLLGLGKVNGRVKLLLDIDQVLSTTEVVDLAAVRASV